jgi:hypothetical protein
VKKIRILQTAVILGVIAAGVHYGGLLYMQWKDGRPDMADSFVVPPTTGEVPVIALFPAKPVKFSYIKGAYNEDTTRICFTFSGVRLLESQTSSQSYKKTESKNIRIGLLNLDLTSQLYYIRGYNSVFYPSTYLTSVTDTEKIHDRVRIEEGGPRFYDMPCRSKDIKIEGRVKLHTTVEKEVIKNIPYTYILRISQHGQVQYLIVNRQILPSQISYGLESLHRNSSEGIIKSIPRTFKTKETLFVWIENDAIYLSRAASYIISNKDYRKVNSHCQPICPEYFKETKNQK